MHGWIGPRCRTAAEHDDERQRLGAHGSLVSPTARWYLLNGGNRDSLKVITRALLLVAVCVYAITTASAHGSGAVIITFPPAAGAVPGATLNSNVWPSIVSPGFRWNSNVKGTLLCAVRDLESSE